MSLRHVKMPKKKQSERKVRLIPFIKNNGHLLVISVVVSAVLLIMNYYTIRILSGVRAYVHGESFYSKGQKDATRHLARYIQTRNEQFWEAYKKDISIPISDRIARLAMLEGDLETAKKALYGAKIHPDDMDTQIWLFVNFKDLPFMKKPIDIWTKGDSIIERQDQLAHDIHHGLQKSDTYTEIQKDSLLNLVYHQSAIITDLEIKFLESMGETSRIVGNLITVFNAILIVIIVGGSSLFGWRIVYKLMKSEDDLLKKNTELKRINRELDRFVYSASHDLRAPITSLQGLIEVASEENEPKKLKKYFGLMNQSLNKQDDFIKKIITFSRNKRLSLSVEEVDFGEMLDQTFDQLRYMKNAGSILLKKELHTDRLQLDKFRMEVVFTNLFSNAIKFIDPRKDQQVIKVISREKENNLEIVIADNGLGIPKANRDRIFDMFYKTTYNTQGSGVGLYIVRETIERMGGTIRVNSRIDVGTEFLIKLPAKGAMNELTHS